MMFSRAPKSLFLRVAAITLAFVAPVVACAAEERSSVSVTGEASVSATPDLAEVDGGVTTEAKTARDASNGTNKAMAAVIAALKKSGVADVDIRTARLSLTPQLPAARTSGSAEIVGYRATNRVIVRVHDIAKVADAIDTMLAAGANDLGSVNFMFSNASKLLDDARSKAVADARHKAEIYAKAAGVGLGAPLSISEATASGPMPQRAFKAGMAAPTPIAVGDETLTLSISVRYEIKPATP
jgi:uncharacterized protein